MELLASGKHDAVLAIVSENGVYDDLYREWFPFLIKDKPSMWEGVKYVAIALLPIVFMILIATVYIIRRKVNIKTQELTATSTKLVFERNKYYSTLVAIGEGVVVVNKDGLIEVINPVAINMLDTSEKEAIGKHYGQVIELISALTDKTLIDPIGQVMRTKRPFVSDGRLLILVSKKQKYFLEVKATMINDEDGEIVDVVVVLTDVSKIKNHLTQIEYLSFHDSLTNLYNRRFFEEEIRRLDTPRNYPLTIVMADINGLKLVNDAFGHLSGDEMIKEAARIMKDELRAGDIIARWGGDEFVIVLPNTAQERVSQIITSMKKACRESVYSFGDLSLSFGQDSKVNSEQTIESIFKNAEEFMYKEKVSETEGTHGETIRIILKTLFEKSPLDKEHCERVSELGVALAKKMKLPQSVISDIKSMGLLHDIGKIIIPSSILEKSSRLSDKEYEEIKKHPLIGYRMLSTSNEFSHIAKGVLQHHERIDGTGYPDGIKGKAISIEAKIIAIVDAYDEMTSYRPYRKIPLTKEEAKDQLVKNMGLKFDEASTKVFIIEVLNLIL